jgi:LEA14-like dessication related protein
VRKILTSKVFIVLMTVLCVGFILAQTLQYPEFKKVNSFKIHSFEQGIFKASIEVGIFNPNWFSIRGTEISFKMSYKNHVIAIGNSDAQIFFKRKSVSALPVELNFYPDSMRNDLKTILLKDSIRLETELSGKFTIFGISTTKKMATWIKTEDLLNALVSQSMEGDGLKLKEVKFISADVETTRFAIDFQLTNTLSLPIELKTMQFDLFAEMEQKNKVAQWDFEINKVIEVNETADIPGEVEVNNLATALSGITKVLNGKFDYYLDGYALIALKGREIQVPIRQHLLVDPLAQKVTIIRDNE